MADPASVLAEYGMEVPEGTSVNVVENSDSTVHITLPLPPTNHHELPDDMLETIAGGVLPTKFLGPSGGWTSEEIAQVFAVDTGSEKGSTWPMPKFRF